MQELLREGSEEEVYEGVGTLIPYVKRIADITGGERVKMRDFKAHNVARSLRPEGGWLVVDFGGWCEVGYRHTLRDRLTEVLADLNRANDFFRFPGLWALCTAWLLGPDTDSSSFKRALRRFRLGGREEAEFAREEPQALGFGVVLDEADRRRRRVTPRG